MKLFELQDRPQLDKEFDRNIMPQIRKNNLEDNGFDFQKKKIKLNKLKPVQSQRVQGMHDRALKGFSDGSIRPIIIDKNNYIVNGHHRYDVARSLDMDKVKVLKVNATVEELIDHFSDTADDTPTMEEQFKIKFNKKFKEFSEGTRCWKGYKKKGTKMMFGKRVPNCVKNEDKRPCPACGDPKCKHKEEHFKEDVVGMNPHAKKPYFTPDEADRANNEWINQAQVDQEDGVIVRGTDDKQYRIMTSYNNEHFEDGEVYLDGLTDPTYIDTEGYPDAAELLYYHSATGHYPEDEDYEVVERNLNPAVKDYVKGKKTKLIKVKVADLDDEAIDDRFGRVIDPDPDVSVDLDEPILLDKDGKTILDGFHRVYQAKRVGRDVIPAEIIENFADGKKKGKSRPGRVKRAGASCKGSVTSLRKKAKNSSGEKSKMYHWCANMKAGRKKSK